MLGEGGERASGRRKADARVGSWWMGESGGNESHGRATLAQSAHQDAVSHYNVRSESLRSSCKKLELGYKIGV